MKALRRLVASALQVVVTIALVAWVLSRNDAPAVLDHLRAVELRWLAAAAGMMAVSVLLGAWQWERLLVVQGVRASARRLLRAYSLGMFLNFVLPTGVGGDFVRAVAVQRDTKSGARGVAATLLDRFVGLFTLAFFAFAASLLLVAGDHDPLFERMALLTGLVSLGFCVVAAILFSRRFLGWFAPLTRWVGEGRLLSTARDLRGAFLEYRTNPGPVLQVVGLSLVVQFQRIVVHAFCAQALGLSIEFAWFLLFVPIVSLVSILPVSVGGWGLREGTQKTFFALPGVMIGVSADMAPSLALAQALLASLVGMTIPALVSAIVGIFISMRGEPDPSGTPERNP
ncbi:MAG: flippase-like domain-containing protein [Fibrobacteria bacterium]|nr:flippase-like domain-containing protein [Fibrobacteria bacterium]